MNLLQKEIEQELLTKLSVPERLTVPDALIISAKESLSENKNYSSYKGVITTTGNNLEIRVAPNNVGRALRFMDTFIKALCARGHDIKIENQNTYTFINGIKIRISFKEKLKKVVIKEKYWDRTEYHPTGVLYFKMDSWGAKEWADGKQRVEKQLSKILAKLEFEAARINEIREVNRQHAEIIAEKQRIQKELEEKQQTELENFKKLLVDANRCHQVNILRTYIQLKETYADTTNSASDFFNEWLRWANEKINWYDPFINAPDELLENVDKDTLTFKKKPTDFF